MITITTYNHETGELTGWIQAPEELIAPTLESQTFVIGQYEGETHYVKGGRVTPRPEMEVEVGDGFLSGVPANSTIRINNKTYPCPQGGAVHLEFNHVGTYQITIECFPYLPKEIKYENKAH